MSKDMVYLLIMLSVAAVALVYNLYQLWITPEKYKSRLVNSVRDWWPFASFYRRWFASNAYIWLFRVIYTIWLLVVLIIFGLFLLGIMGLFP